ncbi:hypothetical protein [Novosphingobium sp.]|uniref:hypothetical protein n=1 Tax=Novosphingobium sp. TaxID=1874826 RepID=UPI0035ADE8F2
MTDDTNDGAWFAPKTKGYGSGLPIAWQGWVMLALHVGIIALGVALLKGHVMATMIWAIGFSLLPMPFYAAKTRGGWKWRWGPK